MGLNSIVDATDRHSTYNTEKQATCPCSSLKNESQGTFIQTKVIRSNETYTSFSQRDPLSSDGRLGGKLYCENNK
jgi:hypothetical protein